MARHPAFDALFHTAAGRIVILGVATRAVVHVVGMTGAAPVLLNVVDTLASLALAAAVAYFAFRLLLVAKRRLLWRVRRKLILSYVFVGFIPAILIVAFFLLCGFLLFYNFTSYLVQSRLRALGDEARLFAQGIALDVQHAGVRDAAAIVAARQAGAAGEFPGMSVAIVPVDRACDGTTTSAAPGSASGPITAGPWSHVDPPTRVPDWIGCEGFAGLLAYADGSNAEAHIVVRAAAFPESPRPAYAAVVDLPVGADVRQRFEQETGIELTGTTAVADDRRAVRPLAGRGRDADLPTSSEATRRSASPFSNPPSLLEYRDWTSGQPGTLMISTDLRMGEFYDRISSAQGRNRAFGQALLVALYIIGGLFVLIEILALGAGLALARSITGSVHELFTGTQRVRLGDFKHKIAVKAPDQLGELAGSFNEMTDSIEDLLREAAEKKRLEEELRIAREIQMSLLPHGPIAIRGLSVTALCVPAREVGGDYYDILPLDDDRVGVLIADVSGKGTSAALYMAELKGIVLSLSRIHRSPRALMIAADRIIAHDLDARSFVTMSYAVIDLSSQTMTFARAGHTPLIIVPGGPALPRRVDVVTPEGLVMGLKIDNGEMFERLLEERTIPLRPGDLFLFFTDGITEAMNGADDCFGEARLGAILEQHADLPPDELRERVLREIQAFVGDAPQHDDMTMIFLRVDEAAVGAVAARAGVAS